MIEAEAIDTNQARMEKDRSSYDSAWAEIARLVYPELDRFAGGGMRSSAWMRNQLQIGGAHDPYAAMALQDGVSVFESYVMPRGQRWQKLELGDEGLMQRVNVQQGLERVERRLFKLRNDPKSGFTAAVHDSAMSLFSFGPQSMWIDDRYDQLGRWAGIRYESEFVGDVWVERDAAGNLLRAHRSIELTAEQARLKWGDDCPESVKKALGEVPPDRQKRLLFLHVIEPNRRYEPGRIDMAGKPWESAYYCCTDKAVFQRGGYLALPRVVSSFNRAGGSTWGRSPTMTVLPIIRMMQEMMLDRAAGAELRLKPPLLATDDELDGAVLELKAFGVTYGGLNDRGEKMVQEFLTAADATDAEKLTMDYRALIDRTYYRDLLQMNREYKTHIPAARIEEEKAEKGTLLSPLARQEQEWLSPMTERELVLMDKAGLLDDLPGEALEYLAAEGTLGIGYDNGLTALQEAGKSAAFLSLAGQVGSLAQIDPTLVEDFKREYPSHRVIPELGRIAGVPASMRATEEEQAAYDAKKAQDAQLAQILEAVPALAGAAKDAAAVAAPVQP